jgi:predicted phosphohydrolase
MAIFAIGDMHLSLGTDKPMDVFPGWEGYLPRLEASWRKLIGPDDTVVLAGDTSWAMNLNGTKADFAFIQNLLNSARYSADSRAGTRYSVDT